MLRDALGNAHAPFAGEPRIVSLVPSLTELVFALGLGDRLVGRTGFCVHPREALQRVPKVGGTKDVKLDRVRDLAPTHLIVNVDENRREDVQAMQAFVPHVVVTHPLQPRDNVGLYRLLGGIFRREGEAAALVRGYEAAEAGLREAVAGLPRERVLYLIWRAPWMSVSRETYIAATLALAGWDTLPAQPAQRYPVVQPGEASIEAIQRVLLPSEPYRFLPRHAQECREIFGKPVLRIDGEMVSWYGSRAIEGLRYLAALRRSTV